MGYKQNTGHTTFVHYILRINTSPMRAITTTLCLGLMATVLLTAQTTRPEFARDSFFIVKYDDTTSDATKAAIRTAIIADGGILEKRCSCNEDLELWKTDPVKLDIVRMGSSSQSGVDTTDYDYEMQFENITDIDDFAGPNFSPTNTSIDESLQKIRPVNNRKIKAAIIDSGVDTDHVSISNYLWDSSMNNCAMVRQYGYDFRNNIEIPEDLDNHGSGVNGVMTMEFPSEAVEIQNGKFYENIGNSFDAVCAMYMAINDEARVINLSFGFISDVEPIILRDAIRFGVQRDLLFVASAGNESDNNDTIARWPANFIDDFKQNLIVVGAYHIVQGSNDTIYAPYSNFGKTRVTVAAPGHQESTNNLGGTSSMYGTSIAAPYVSRLAISIWNDVPSATPQQIIECIEASAIPVANMMNLNKTGGIVNPNTTTNCAAILPIEMNSFQADLVNNNVVELVWRANATNDSYFEIHKSTTGSNWSQIGRLASNPEQIEYSFIDKYPSNGTSYYKIVQQMPDGSNYFSSIETVRNDIQEIGIFPNPNTTGFIVIEGVDLENTHLKIHNLDGVLLWDKRLAGASSSQIKIPNFTPGTYIVTVLSQVKEVRKRIIVQ